MKHLASLHVSSDSFQRFLTLAETKYTIVYSHLSISVENYFLFLVKKAYGNKKNGQKEERCKPFPDLHRSSYPVMPLVSSSNQKKN